jgi:hypothetical protein
MPKRKSCGSVLRSGLPPLVPMRSINLPTASLMHSACRPRDRKRARRWYQNLRSAAASQCPTPRDFVPWRFSAAGRLNSWIGHHSGGRKPAHFETCAVQQNDPYSITLSTSASRVGGIPKPSILAVCRLMTNSHFGRLHHRHVRLASRP